ncbi:MAG: hypothetical protein HZC38_04480 [Chloroflexi bacterium]|nr:hypothetical protein [Chloroflexota bacterium]
MADANAGLGDKITDQCVHEHYVPVWSPDSLQIGFVDCKLALYSIDIKTKKLLQLATDAVSPNWSP